jgi:hypothetical protein
MGFIKQFLDDARPDSLQNAVADHAVGVRVLERRTLNVQTLGQITPQVGTRLDTLGHVSVTRLNRVLLFSSSATPVIQVPPDALTGSNIFEVVLTGQFHQNTGSNQTITPRFYIGKTGSETLVTSDTALTVSSGATRKTFEYRIRVTAGPAGGTTVQVDEKFDLENATAGTMSTIMRTTRTTVIDITQLSEIDSCFIRIANGATATMFRIYSNTLSVQILDAVQTGEIHWYSQPDASTGLDTYIAANAATSNFGAQTVMGVGESNSGVGFTWRGLIKFPDLGNFVTDPDLIGFQVSSAYLYLVIAADQSSNSRTLEAFRLLVDFNASQATWNIRKTATNWGTAGGQSGVDYAATAIGSSSFGASETVGIVKSIALDAVEMQKIIDGTYPNHGFLLKMQTELDDAYTFHTADSATPDLAPMLYIIGTRPN